MATLERLLADDVLIEHQPELDFDEFAERKLYLSPEFDEWADTVLLGAPRDRGGLTPYDQVDELFHDYVIGRRLVYEQERKVLQPQTRWVWELKTADVRVFGWFAARARFIAVAGELKINLSNNSAYAPYIQQVIDYRDALDLDPPKYVPGVRLDEVL